MRWEYLVTTLTMSDEEKFLNGLGAKGWELVAVAPDSETSYKTAYLKRAILQVENAIADLHSPTECPGYEQKQLGAIATCFQTST